MNPSILMQAEQVSRLFVKRPDYAERLAGLTGHDIAATPTAGNFTVMFVNEDERRKIGPRLSRIIPGIPPGDIEAIQALPPQNYCTVFAYSLGPSPLYSEAVAIIRAMRGAGSSYRQVAKALNDAGIPTAQGGREWYASTVRAIEQRAK